MNAIEEKKLCDVSQQQLAYMREKYLKLMVADMKILKGYINELKELGLELKKNKRQSTATLESGLNYL